MSEVPALHRPGAARLVMVREIVLFVGLLLLIVVALAEIAPIDRPLTTPSPWPGVGAVTIWGTRLAYRHRRSGRWAMLAWGSAAVIATAGLIAGMELLIVAIGPWVRAQSWLIPVLVSLVVGVALVLLAQRRRRQRP